MSKKKPILVFSAHSDDFVFGAGGTIANHSNKNLKVHSVVFSYGEKSHPWLKEKEVKDMRSKEAFDAGKVLGTSVEFFDLKELNFINGAKEKKTKEKLIKIIKKIKPSKIFTHSSEDPHPDHQSVYKLTLEAVESFPKKQQPEIYVYSVWNPVEFQTSYPALYVNIRKTFNLKIKALKKFPSQKFHAIYPLMFMVFFRAIKNGFKIRTLFGEKFYRIK